MCNICRHLDCGCQALKLEVGKTYITRGGKKAKLVSLEYKSYSGGADQGLIIYLEHPFGCYANISENVLVKEYIPPVVHKRDVVWYKTTHGKDLYTHIVSVGVKMTGEYKEIHRQTVEYQE